MWQAQEDTQFPTLKTRSHQETNISIKYEAVLLERAPANEEAGKCSIVHANATRYTHTNGIFNRLLNTGTCDVTVLGALRALNEIIFSAYFQHSSCHVKSCCERNTGETLMMGLALHLVLFLCLVYLFEFFFGI